MKTNVTRLLKPLFIGLLVAIVSSIPGVARAQEIIHAVTGSGLTVVENGPGAPFSFRQSISAWQKADGTSGGSTVVQVWNPDGHLVTMVGEILSLTVNGNTASYTLVVTHSNSTDPFFAVGGLAKGFVTDNKGVGPDYAYSGPSFLPFLPVLPVVQGNFVVR